jgi:predicted AAA+ superfamily ATPase
VEEFGSIYLGKVEETLYFCLGKEELLLVRLLRKTEETMLTRKIDAYLKRYYEQTNRALLVTGARQTGKTFSIRQFGKLFRSFIEINFVESPEAVNLFKQVYNSRDLLLRLSAYAQKPLIKGETLVFFDEVQKCPDIVSAIKFLVDEGSYRYILSGSLLGVELNDLRSQPVGYMGIKEMFPLDFEEFITCVGMPEEVIAAVRTAWEQLTEVDAFVHTKMMELFRLYLVVGGMPAAVSEYVNTNNLQRVTTTQQDIIRLYKKDIAQYNPNNKLYLEEIFSLIPPELNAKNKRFILKDLNEHAKFAQYENSFLWLKHAGVAIPVYNAEEPKVPLLLSRSRNLFKLFQNDIGLLAVQYADGIQLRIINGDKHINYGSIYENLVAQELLAHGMELYYYNSKKQGELDFLIERNGEVFPIEVKSGKDYERHRALSNIMENGEFHIPQALVLNNDNLRVEERIVYAPIYMVMFIQKANVVPETYKIDLSGL